MIRRSTWMVLGSFFALLVVAIVISRSDPELDASTPVPRPEPLWELTASSIEGLLVENLESGVLVDLRRDVEFGWLLLQPQQGPADAAKIEEAVSWLARPQPLRVLASEENLLQFGLLDPRGRVTIILNEEESEILIIGNDVPTGNSTYIAIEGKPEVYVVSKFSIDSVTNLTVEDLLVAQDVELDETETPLP
ncbi:MAG: DUF4340 domain-containing protein [Chloroflexi bacterium]|nr:DUF4340 domain-containing protein [Chloroflexota bacterium]